MQVVEHSSVELSTHVKKKPRPHPVWIGRYIIDGKDSRKVLGKAYTKRGRPPAGFLTHTEAENDLSAFLEAERGRLRSLEGVCFDVAADAFTAALVARIGQGDFRATTLRSYRNIMKEMKALPTLGSRPLRAITAEDLKAYRSALVERGAAASTINQHRSILSGIFKHAIEELGVETSPMDGFKRMSTRRVGSGAISFYPPEEILALMAHADGERDAALYLTAGFTGLRASELRGLRWRGLDFDRSLVHVEKGYTDEGGEELPKSWKVRSVPMMPQVAQALTALRQRERFTADNDLVFPNEIGGFLNYMRMYKRYKKAQRAAGLRPLRFHDLRHSFGTMAVRRFPITDVKVWMGHADIQTTQKYIHYAPQDNAAAILGGLAGGEVLAPVIPIREAPDPVREAS